MQRVIPKPVSVEPAPTGAFTFTETTAIVAQPGNADAARIAQFLSALIGSAPDKTPPRVDTSGGSSAPGNVHLVLGSVAEAGDEGYELIIAPERVTITANKSAGLFYGVQTLRQLLPPYVEYNAAIPDKARPLVLPAGRIVDRPRFVWRGAMLDVARHFFDLAQVKRYIDLLVLYKINRLHLHLSDDQGWRIEIKSWPNLTRHGGSTAVGGGPGGFYTQESYTELVKYAQDRFMTVVPEIDMPGHTNAALSSYPELNCDGTAPPLYTGINVGFSTFCIGKDITYKFIDDVVREIGALSAAPYFHVGGDEVQKLTPEQYRQFIERVQGIVQKNGKEMIGWDEIAPITLLPTTIVQHWRPKGHEGLAKASRLIMSPANRAYLDMKYDKETSLGLSWAGYVDLRTAYDWDPGTLVAGIPAGAVLGVESPIWSETLVQMQDVEFMAFPRLPAIAEIGWSAGAREWTDFSRRLGAQAPRWVALGVNFYRAPEVVWER
jgi:hexosaminidase